MIKNNLRCEIFKKKNETFTFKITKAILCSAYVSIPNKFKTLKLFSFVKGIVHCGFNKCYGCQFLKQTNSKITITMEKFIKKKR